jgi:hypothetical protein
LVTLDARSLLPFPRFVSSTGQSGSAALDGCFDPNKHVSDQRIAL